MQYSIIKYNERETVWIKLINAIMADLNNSKQVNQKQVVTIGLTITYNVFAFHEDNGDGDEWISIKLEQYDDNEDCINCELHSADTDDMSLAGLETAILVIVSWYMNNINI